MSSGPIWARPEPGRRRPRFTREQIAMKALEIADSEGFEAVSMRRLALELGAGTMTLYHYVATKADLVELMDDAIMAEVLVPEGEMPSGWRDALATVARRSFGAYRRHPWAYAALQTTHFGPNGMLHFEQSLQALDELGVSPEERFELFTLVDDYVFGYVSRWISPPPPQEEISAALQYVKDRLGSGGYPRVEALVGRESPEATWERLGEIVYDDARFERGLQMLLDGIELDLKRRRPAPRGRSRGPRAR